MPLVIAGCPIVIHLTRTVQGNEFLFFDLNRRQCAALLISRGRETDQIVIGNAAAVVVDLGIGFVGFGIHGATAARGGRR